MGAKLELFLRFADAQSGTIDPTLQVLLTIFGGALVAAIAGFVGAFIQGRREHNRWVRERRYEAFVRAYALVKGFDLNSSKTRKIAEEVIEGEDSHARDARIEEMLAQSDALYQTVAEALAPIIVMGPDDVAEQIIKMQIAYEADDSAAQKEAEGAFVSAARSALKSKG